VTVELRALGRSGSTYYTIASPDDGSLRCTDTDLKEAFASFGALLRDLQMADPDLPTIPPDVSVVDFFSLAQ
jgi:hypothetical protein